MNNTVITVDATGGAQALHNDEFSLDYLGRMEVRRQTDISYNTNTKMWEITYIDHDSLLDTRNKRKSEPTMYSCPELRVFVSYESARRVEVEWLSACREQSILPHSPEGLAVLRKAVTAEVGDQFDDRKKIAVAFAPAVNGVKALRCG